MRNNNGSPVNNPTAGYNTAVNQPMMPSFKEIANFKMNDLQQQTMKILVEEDNQVEKLRDGKMSITTDEDDVENTNFIEKKSNKSQLKEKHINKINTPNQTPTNVKNTIQKNQKIQNGPINFSRFNLNSNNLFSFMELKSESTVQAAGGKYTKPIAVLMKLPGDPDPKLKSEIGKMEKNREGFEAKMFKKAKEEFKLITALTKKELQINLNHELIPFFVVSKNALKGINDVITTTIPAQTGVNQPKFIQIDHKELKDKFPHLNLNDEKLLNQHVYSKIMNFFADTPIDKKAMLNDIYSENKNIRTERQNNIQMKNIPTKNLRSTTQPQHQHQPQSINNKIPDMLKRSINFNYKKCLELTKHLKNLDCKSSMNDYNKLNSHLYSSFLEMKGGGGDDLINVKFAASDEPYPTIEKLVAQMMTRRDLAEKFERLKILEYESHLQKAENEMIQDILHENLYRIMATYGPSIEGMKEHIH